MKPYYIMNEGRVNGYMILSEKDDPNYIIKRFNKMKEVEDYLDTQVRESYRGEIVETEEGEVLAVVRSITTNRVKKTEQKIRGRKSGIDHRYF